MVIFGVNEHNLDTTQPAIKRNLLDIEERVIKNGQQLIATSSESFPRAYKPEGTSLGLSGLMTSRKEYQCTDKQGR